MAETTGSWLDYRRLFGDCLVAFLKQVIVLEIKDSLFWKTVRNWALPPPLSLKGSRSLTGNVISKFANEFFSSWTLWRDWGLCQPKPRLQVVRDPRHRIWQNYIQILHPQKLSDNTSVNLVSKIWDSWLSQNIQSRHTAVACDLEFTCSKLTQAIL
jgi:hypothetical protein